MDDDDLATANNVDAIPTFQFFQSGTMIKKMIGASQSALKEAIDDFIGTPLSSSVLSPLITEEIVYVQENTIRDDYNEYEPNDDGGQRILRTLIEFEITDENDCYVSFEQIGIITIYTTFTIIKIQQ